jgi:hypothetical protein
VLQQWLDFAAAADKRGGQAGRDKSSDLPAYSPSSGRSSGGSVSADHHRREASSAAEAGRQARTTLCLELLPPHLRANHAWRLNALVGVDCEAVRLRSRGGGGNGGGHSSSHSSGGGSGGGALAEAERVTDVLGVLYALVRALAKRCAAVVVIDDAHALDPESWALAHALATGPPEASDDAAAPDLPPSPPNAPPAGQSYREDNTHAEVGGGGATSSSGHPPPMPRLLLVLAMRPMAAYGPTFKRTAPDYEALAALSESRPDTVVTARLLKKKSPFFFLPLSLAPIICHLEKYLNRKNSSNCEVNARPACMVSWRPGRARRCRRRCGSSWTACRRRK